MAFIYEVNDDNAVSIWIDNSSEAPVIFQAETPEGSAWGNKAEAESWAAAEIAMLEAVALASAEAEALRLAEIEAEIPAPEVAAETPAVAE